MSKNLFSILNINNSLQKVKEFSAKTGIPYSRLLYYNDYNILPYEKDLSLISRHSHISEIEIQLQLGLYSNRLKELLSEHYEKLSDIISEDFVTPSKKYFPESADFKTTYGRLYKKDCFDFLSSIDTDTVDLIFADPPFNLNKTYPSKIDDNLKNSDYLSWVKSWLNECSRILKFGGSLFLWNLPKWNIIFAYHLSCSLNFKHWISVDLKYGLPIYGRLYPSHYSLLHFCKGERPTTFHPDRLPMEICNKCFHELKDYGGYKKKMNPLGINLTDIWYDIPPVRHSKYKKRKKGNELSLKLLDRIIQMSTNEGDLICDPFGGSGTTYIAAELKKRNWIGSEIGPIDDIIRRFKNISE
jgi:site-specific DNA-methyltransferase (adenine-specific)